MKLKSVLLFVVLSLLTGCSISTVEGNVVEEYLEYNESETNLDKSVCTVEVREDEGVLAFSDDNSELWQYLSADAFMKEHPEFKFIEVNYDEFSMTELYYNSNGIVTSYYQNVEGDKKFDFVISLSKISDKSYKFLEMELINDITVYRYQWLEWYTDYISYKWDNDGMKFDIKTYGNIDTQIINNLLQVTIQSTSDL